MSRSQPTTDTLLCNAAIMAWYKDPVMITEGKMQYLYDETGRRYLDVSSGSRALPLQYQWCADDAHLDHLHCTTRRGIQPAACHATRVHAQLCDMELCLDMAHGVLTDICMPVSHSLSLLLLNGFSHPLVNDQPVQMKYSKSTFAQMSSIITKCNI